MPSFLPGELPMQLAGAAPFRWDRGLQFCTVPTTPFCFTLGSLPPLEFPALCLSAAHPYSLSEACLFLSSCFWKIDTGFFISGPIDLSSLITSSLSSFPQPNRTFVICGWWKGALLSPLCFSQTLCLCPDSG